MRIVLANENLGQGGAERFTLALGRALRRANHRIWLACRADSWLAQQDLDCIPIPFASEIDPRSHWAYFKKVRPLRPQVLHSQASRDLALLGAWPESRLLKSEHSFLDSAGSCWLRRCYRHCRAIVPVSHALRRQMEEVLGPRFPYEVIPNALDLPSLSISPPEIMQHHIWFGYIGSISKEKGSDHLLAASLALLRHQPQRRLLLAGEGPEREPLLQRLAQEGLLQQVWAPGQVPDPLPYLAGLKVLLQASPRETFSLVALEAMALQVPVVGYARYGLTEVVQHGQNGTLCPQLEPLQLQQAVEAYLQDEDLRQRHGRSGRQRVQDHFTWSQVLPRWEQLYRGNP